MPRHLPLWTFLAVAPWLVTGCSPPPPPPAPPAPPAAVAPATPATTAPQPADEPATASVPDLAALRRTLAETDDGRIRVLTIDEIAQLGGAADAALPELIAATRDADPRPRWHAARAIGLIGSEASSALPRLVELLADTDPVVVTQAAAAIALIREDELAGIDDADAARYAAVVEPLVMTAVHPDPRARRAALRALGVLAPEPGAYLQLYSRQLAEADPSVVMPALHTIADMEDKAVPALVTALSDPDSRYWATVVLAEIGAEAAPAVDALATVAAEGEFHERLQAIVALAEIGPAAAAAAPVLIAALEGDEPTLRFAAAFALGKSRAKAADAALEKAAAADDQLLGEIAAWARAEIRPDDEACVTEALRRLRGGLTNADPEIRKAAVSGLSDIAASSDQAVRRELAGDFVGLLTDADPGVGTSAGAALVRLGGDAVAAVEPLLAKPATRLAAAEVLAAVGKAAKPALPALVAALADPDENFASDAALVIAAIGPEAESAVPDLQKRLADDTPAEVRYAAAFALGSLGPAAKPAAARLAELAQTEDPLLATVAVWAALKIEPGETALFDRAIPLLRRALASEREIVRLEAAVSLGEIGPAAKTAIPMLELVAEDDPAKAVRAAAAAAVKRVRGG